MMKKFQNILALLRVRHYIKNLFVYIPLFFMGKDFSVQSFWNCCMGFAAFSLTASIVYTINDIKDLENDRLHPTKKNRPLASGSVSKFEGLLCAAFCLLSSVIISIILIVEQEVPLYSCGYLSLYFVLNILYSLGLKNFPIVDIIILMSGFLIRVMYGAVIAQTFVSSWLYLTVISGAFYLGLGKRRGELRGNTADKTRKVLKSYNMGFLDKFMYMCLTMAVVFYSLWAKEYSKEQVIWTVPIVIVICMQYSLNVEGNSDGDPVEVVLKDKKLIVLCFLLFAVLISIIYLV